MSEWIKNFFYGKYEGKKKVIRAIIVSLMLITVIYSAGIIQGQKSCEESCYNFMFEKGCNPYMDTIQTGKDLNINYDSIEQWNETTPK